MPKMKLFKIHHKTRSPFFNLNWAFKLNLETQFDVKILTIYHILYVLDR